ncbi:MAG: FAD-binding protein [Proteobacteria bacterium]|nr:FAD-binding protein [Pseudomonadota bacterium]
MQPGDPHWASPVEQPRIITDERSLDWDDSADLVIVGFGGAGVAAAVEAVDSGLDVLAVDRYEGGGSSAANGGVFYAGGGTRIQREAGVQDTPEDMFRYLRLETRGVVSDRTLRRFCEESPATVDWLLAHGARLSSSGVFTRKVSYPPLKYHLYHPDNSLVPAYAAQARPAARGHRTAVSNHGKAWGLGVGIWQPLAEAARSRGLRSEKYTECRQLIVDTAGRVLGAKVLGIPAGSAAARRFARCIRRANRLLELIPPVIPLAAVTIALARRYLAAAARIEATQRVTRHIRARHGVLLSAGGFILNTAMVEHYAPLYRRGLPNGTLGDTGSGIRLGESAGGAVGSMDRVTGWCMINPPAAWPRGIVVDRNGQRIIHEGVYGSTLGDAVAHSPGGVAFLILDEALYREGRRQVSPGHEYVKYQRQVAHLNMLMNRRSAPTPQALAQQLGIDPAALTATIDTYNRAARGEIPDAFGKVPDEMSPLAKAPLHAIDISVHSRYFPMPMLTLGGLRVDEDNGQVLREDGSTIGGLYAAGRTAVGICSNVYMSGLAYADCVFSGRRAARAVVAAKLGAAAPPAAAGG